MADTVTSTIRTQNGGSYRITHPADYTDAQVQAAAAAYLKQAEPEMSYPGAQVERPKPESFLQGVAEGAAVPLNNAARLLETGADAVGLADPLSDLSRSMGMSGTVGEAEAVQQQASEASPYQGSGLGRFTGNIVGTAPTLALPGGPLAQGAASGALLTSERDPLGIAKDAAIGAGGAALGSAVTRGASFLANPEIPAPLRTLIDEGVRVTPGQVARSIGGRVGNFVARREDRATSTPFVGDAISEGRNQSFDDFGRATINRSLRPIGEQLPDGMPVGREAVSHAGDRLSQRYDDITANIGTFQADQQFVQNIAQIQAHAAEMLPQRAEQLDRILQGVGRFFGNGGTTLDGDALKAIETRLGDRIRKLSRSQDADQQDLAEALEMARSAARDLAARAHPELAADLQAVNQGWKSLVQVEKASGNSRGTISPAGYSQAVRQSSDTVRNRGYSRGNALNQDLSDAASDILPSGYADSGTAGRWQQSNMIANLLGAAQVPGYAAARGVANAVTRTNYLSPQLQALLEYAAPGVGILSAGGVQELMP